MALFGVWVQPVDSEITPANLDQYGSVHDIEAEYRSDDGGTPNKQFCDGQTSKTPPRYATDQMVSIYTRSQEAAQEISRILRENVVQRIQAGELNMPLMAYWEPPVWNVPLTSPTVLPRLQARVYAEFPEYDIELLRQVLDTVLKQKRQTLDMRSILTQVKELAGSGQK
jgi:hypothetical protein